jgi:hypothetical protein
LPRGAALTNENLAFQRWNWLVALGGIEVMVLEPERDLALVLLAPVAIDARNAESDAFKLRPMWNCIGTLIAVVTLGLWMPFWIRHRRISPAGSDGGSAGAE